MDTLQLIKTKEQELQPLYARMNADHDAVYMAKYTMKGISGPLKDQDVPDVLNITMNRPGVFFKAINAMALSACANAQVRVEGLPDTQNSNIEQFFTDAEYTADKRIAKRGWGSLNDWLCDHVPKRGYAGVRVTWNENGLPEYLPVDMRFCPYETDVDGAVWAAPHFKRKGSVLKKQYPKIDKIQKLDDAQKYEGYDFWNADVNEIWIDEHLVRTLKNPYGYCNFVIERTSGGYEQDEDNLVHQGESIFWLVRQFITEWNRIISILQTKAYETVKPTYTHEDKGGTEAQQYPPALAANMPVAPGETPELLQKPPLDRFFAEALNQISKGYQQGSLSDADLGDVTLGLTAMEITKYTEVRQMAFKPVSDCIMRTKIGCAEMAIRGMKVHAFSSPKPIGRAGGSHTYKASDFPDPETYTIEIDMVPDNAQQTMAEMTVGLAMKGELSRKTRVERFYHCKDPDEELDRLAAEEAAQANPSIFYMDKAERLLDQADKAKGEPDKVKSLKRRAQVMADNMVNEIHKAILGKVDSQQGTAGLQTPQSSPMSTMALPSLMGSGKSTKQPLGAT